MSFVTKFGLCRHLAAAFLFGFLWIAICWIGLPTDFNADHVTINLRGTRALSYLELAKLTLNPQTPAWFYPAARLMEYLRPLQFLWMKAYFEHFGPSLVPFHVTAAVGSGLLSAVIFFLIVQFGSSVLLGWLAIILYASFPSNFFMLTSTFSGDFQYYISILSIAALLLFSRMSSGKFRGVGLFLGSVVVWFVLLALAIKLKSSEKILPFICLSFLVVRIKGILPRIGVAKFILLIMCLLASLILVVPTASYGPNPQAQAEHTASAKPLSEKDTTTFKFQWRNMLQRTFFVPGGDFPFTSFDREKQPRSFSENYGFFLSWLFWLGLAASPVFMRKAASTPSLDAGNQWELKQQDFCILMIWFAATVAGFANGLSVYDTRFLNFAYVPSILIFFMVYAAFEQAFNIRAAKRRWLRAGLIFCVLYTAWPNYGFYTKLLMHFGGLQAALVRAETDKFTAVYGRPPAGWELYERHGDLERERTVIDWYELGADWLEQTSQKIQKHRPIYFYTRVSDSPRLAALKEAGYEIAFWKRYDFLDADPLLFRFFKIVSNVKAHLRKKKKTREILVYTVAPSGRSV